MFLYIDSRAALNDRDLDPGGGSGGHLGIFWVGMCRPDSKLAARSEKKFFLKLIPHSRNGPTFYTPF